MGLGTAGAGVVGAPPERETTSSLDLNLLQRPAGLRPVLVTLLLLTRVSVTRLRGKCQPCWQRSLCRREQGVTDTLPGSLSFTVRALNSLTRFPCSSRKLHSPSPGVCPGHSPSKLFLISPVS